jgi:hypothetical protein
MYLPGGVGHLALLQVEPRIGKLVEVADVVVMHVGEDDVLDRARVDAKEPQALRRTTQEGAPPLLGHFRGEAGIHHAGRSGPDHQPGVVVHRHGPVVRVAADEMVAPACLARRVAQRIDFVFGELSLHGLDLVGGRRARLQPRR